MQGNRGPPVGIWHIAVSHSVCGWVDVQFFGINRNLGVRSTFPNNGKGEDDDEEEKEEI